MRIVVGVALADQPDCDTAMDLEARQLIGDILMRAKALRELTGGRLTDAELGVYRSLELVT